MRVRPSRVRRLRTRKAIGNAVVATVLISAGVTYLAIQKTVTLVVDGRPQSVRTLSANVGELLSVTGIALDGRDQVEPPPSTPLSDGMTVVVDTQPLTATMTSSKDVGVWVTEGASGPLVTPTVGRAESSLSAEGWVGTSPPVHARVVVKGKEHDVLTNADTVGALLSAMGISPDPSDRVLPSPKTPLHDGALVAFTDVDVRTRRVVQSIPFDTLTSYTRSLAPGVVRVASGGRTGRLLEVYRVKAVDGRVVSRTLLRRQVLEEAQPRHRLVGSADTSIHGSENGEASWYSFAPGSGLTAAHPWLPFGTVVTVTNLENGKQIQVVINDRGPFGGRVIDLSEEAFSSLASLGHGVIDVRLTW
ncbi:MAG: ubiquitin-like domain-containing protein [Actinomycetota bacterium]